MFNMVNAGMAKRKPQGPNHGRSDHRGGGDRRPREQRPNDRHQGRERPSGRSHAGGRYWLYGHHAVIAALSNPDRRCGELLVTAAYKEAHGDNPAFAGAAVASRQDLDAVLPEGAVHQGIALQVMPLPDRDLDDVFGAESPSPSDCVAVLDQATDPRNIGAVLRTAAAFGIRCVIVQDRNAPPETGTMAKAASGALEHVPLVRVTNLARELETLKSRGFWCIGLDGHAEANLSEMRMDGPTAFVFGAEGRGLRRLTRETCDVLARIPLSDKVESLNLANAASIALYEWAR
jgi:23S rRNA (guanosine2251-2'-O)-methyltransferase